MKQIIIAFSFLLVAWQVSFIANAQEDWRIERKKSITKIYSLSAGQKVAVNNQFGKVVINNWDRNQVKADIVITTHANEESMAAELLDAITIRERTGDIISFETKIDEVVTTHKSRNHKKNMQIDYEIYLPATTSLVVKNAFGNTFVPNRTGETNLAQSFGELTIGKLVRLNDLKVEFGKLNAESLTGNTIRSSYSDVNVKELSGLVKGVFDFCSKLQLKLSNTQDDVNINASYSELKLLLPELPDGTFRFKTSFGDLKNKSVVLKVTDESKGKKEAITFDKIYRAKSGNGKASININCNFGTISVQ